MYHSNQDRTVKRIVQKLLYEHVNLRKYRGVVGLLGTDVYDLMKFYKEIGAKKIISYEKNARNMVMHSNESQCLNNILPLAILDGDILDGSIFEGFFYDLDLCCTVKLLDERIKKFGRLDSFAITLSCPDRPGGSDISISPHVTVKKFCKLMGEELNSRLCLKRGDRLFKESTFSTNKNFYLVFVYKNIQAKSAGRTMEMITILKMQN